METLKKICSHLEDCVLGELGKDKSQINAKELGEVMDAIKDAKMAMYYASIVEAMEEASEEGEEGVAPKTQRYYTRRRRDSRGRYMYTEPMMSDDMMMEQQKGSDPYMTHYYEDAKMNSQNWGGQGNRHYYTDSKMMKHWYEHKDMGDENKKLQGLEKDLKDLSEEVTEMVGEMSNAEKQMLRTKMQNIAQKI